jgi:molybdate/tungstate transport system substrate-binding protein
MLRSTFLVGSAAVLGAGVPFAARAEAIVSVLYAGSLVTVMDRTVVPSLAKQGLSVRGEPKGSVALANLIESGLRRPDVFISADAAVFKDLLAPASPAAPDAPFCSWYATFAATRLVIGYAPGSPFAHDFALVARGEKRLTDVLLEPGLRLGRTDPALDPKGYRSIIAAKLLEAHGGPPNFAARLLGADENPAQILPEETVLARLESGELDAAFLYATESVSRGVPEVELPKFANLGDPALADVYATQGVTVRGVHRVGSAAVYALAILRAAPHGDAAVQFVSYLFSAAGSDVLGAAGVTVLKPAFFGDRAAVPDAVMKAIPSA